MTAPALPARRVVVAAVLLLAAVCGTVLSRTASAGTPLTGVLTGSTATLVGGTGTWTGTNVTRPLRTATWPTTSSLVATAKAKGAVVVQSGAPGAGASTATPGSTWTGSVFVRAATTSQQVQAGLTWYDAAGRELATERVAGPAVSDSTATWTMLPVAGRAPATAASVVLQVRWTATAAGERHDVAQPVLKVSKGGSSALAGPLRTVGNQVVDANGATVVLRGVNRSGMYDRARPGGLTQADIAAIKAWGANVVRLPLGQQVWLPGCASYDPTYAAAVDDVVRWASALGMLTVLDLQYSAPSCDAAGLNPMPDAGSVTFWQQVAARYANAPLVAFDLFNEPHDVSDLVWRDGGPAVSVSGQPYTAVGMTALYDAVRGTGADNLVLVGGLGWASTWPTTAPLAATRNVAYAVHAYNCDKPWTCTTGTGISWMLDRFVTPSLTNPVVVTEFGWPEASTARAYGFQDNVISYAESRGWGWLAWQWSPDGTCSTTSYWDLLADGSCGTGRAYEPSAAGMPVLAGLTRNR